MKLTKTHLVSKVLIKQFCKNSKTNVFNLKTKKWENKKSPAELAYIKFPDQVIKKSENRWNNLVEKKLQNTIDDLWKNNFYKNTNNLEIIKSLISLHFVRSFSFLNLLNKTEKEIYKEFFIEANKKYDLKNEDIRRDWLINLINSLPALIDDQIDKVQKFIFQFDLEIAIAPKNNKFIIGDAPVINISNDRRIGVINGVALKNSTGLFLPITPNHIVSLTNKKNDDKYIKLSAKNVKTINTLTKENCLNQFYCF